MDPIENKAATLSEIVRQLRLKSTDSELMYANVQRHGTVMAAFVLLFFAPAGVERGCKNRSLDRTAAVRNTLAGSTS